MSEKEIKNNEVPVEIVVINKRHRDWHINFFIIAVFSVLLNAFLWYGGSLDGNILSFKAGVLFAVVAILSSLFTVFTSFVSYITIPRISIQIVLFLSILFLCLYFYFFFIDTKFIDYLLIGLMNKNEW